MECMVDDLTTKLAKANESIMFYKKRDAKSLKGAQAIVDRYTETDWRDTKLWAAYAEKIGAEN